MQKNVISIIVLKLKFIIVNFKNKYIKKLEMNTQN